MGNIRSVDLDSKIDTFCTKLDHLSTLKNPSVEQMIQMEIDSHHLDVLLDRKERIQAQRSLVDNLESALASAYMALEEAEREFEKM